jgi:RimJ/RimL family protein N-acetyltransferase
MAQTPEATANLNDGVVYLRELAKSDLDRTLDWMNRSEIRTAIRNRGPVTLESQEAWFERLRKTRDKVVYAICLTEDHQHVGNLSLDQIDPDDRNARFSIFIADEGARERGIGSRAMRLLMLDAFHNRGLVKIWCKTTAGNQKVLDFYTKLGFQVEGNWRHHECIDGKFVDKILLGLLSTEWQYGPSTW